MATVTNSASSTAASAADVFNKLNGTSGTSASSSSKTANSTAEMEDRFLTLLMTQMKNQDPLNPLDNAQVTTQLSQLSMVSGIEKLNSTLTDLLGGYNEALGMQAASIIGKNVMMAGNTLPLASGNAVGAVKLDGAADTVDVTIKNAAGTVVSTESLGAQKAGNVYFSWDGKDNNGKTLSDGSYTFTVEAKSNGTKVNSTAMQIGTVSAVTRASSGFQLDMGTLGSVAFKDVQQIL